MDFINPDALDFEAAEAASLILPNYGGYRFFLIGAGGTGSHLAPEVVRFAVVLREMGQRAEVIIIDPDKVEHKNTYRQNFCPAEVGQYKAVTLAARLGLAWGIEVPAIVAPFAPAMIGDASHCVNILIGCVDSPEARAEINAALRRRYFWHQSATPVTWHLDCGNSFRCGTVRLGAVTEADEMRGAFPVETVCHALPAPALQEPALIQPKSGEARRRPASCAELLLAGEQSLTINKAVASIAADFLYQLCVSKELTRYATFLDLATGVMNSEYITPRRVAALIDQPVEFVLAPHAAALAA